jgi:hypothetical protein
LVKKHKPFLLATSKEAFFMQYKLKFEGLDLNCLVLTRKVKNKGTKPEQYLFCVNSKAYVSSLFPIPNQPDVFQVDFKALGMPLYAVIRLNHSTGCIDVLKAKTGYFEPSEFQGQDLQVPLDNNRHLVINSITSKTGQNL